MQDESNQPQKIDPRLKAAISHPRRLEILGYLMQKWEGTGKRELAEALRLPVPQVGYHLRVLHDADLIAYLMEPRGQTERSYIAAAAMSRR